MQYLLAIKPLFHLTDKHCSKNYPVYQLKHGQLNDAHLFKAHKSCTYFRLLIYNSYPWCIKVRPRL